MKQHDDQKPCPLQDPALHHAETKTVPFDGPIHTAAPIEIPGYELGAKLGQGGMGAVYRAVQLATSRDVALKVMSAMAVGSDRARRRFEREVELASNLEHPNIARVYDSGLVDGVYFYAMRLIDGQPLHTHAKSAALNDHSIIELLVAICRGVEFGHRKGVIHRDLKPQNIMIDADGTPYVLDFGLAKQLDSEATQLSMEGEVAGTLAYMSPEQATGQNAAVDTRTDVYALGVILYQLLLHEHPHNLKGSTLEVIHRIAMEEPKRPRSVRPGLPGDIEAILLKCLEKKPEQRYGSAGGMARDLEQYLNNEPVSARPATATYFLRKALTRHKAAVAVLLSTLVLIAASVLSHVRALRAEQARTESARMDAVQQRAIALQNASRATDQARVAARAQRAAEHNLYYNKVALAQSVGKAGDWMEAKRLLEQCNPTLRNFEWHYLYNRFDVRAHFLASRCRHVDWSRNGDRIVVSGKAGVTVFDSFSRQKVASFEMSSSRQSIAISPDGRHLAIGGAEPAIRDLAGESQRSLDNQSSYIRALSWSGDGHVAGVGSDGRVFVWRESDTGLVAEVNPGRNTSQAKLSADSQLILTTDPHHQRIWEVASSKLLRSSKDIMTRPADFSPDASRYVILGDDLIILETRNGAILNRGSARSAGIAVSNGRSPWVRWSPDGSKIAVGSETCTVIFDALSLQAFCKLPGSLVGVFSPDGAHIALVENDDDVRVWPTSLPPAWTGWAGIDGVSAFSPDGRWFVAGRQVFDRESGALHVTLDDIGYVRRMAFCPRSRRIAATLSKGVIVVWRTDTWKVEHRFGPLWDKWRGFAKGRDDLAFSPDGNRLVTAAEDGNVRVWALTAGKISHILPGRSRPNFRMPPAAGVAWYPLDRYIATTGGGYMHAIWDSASGELLRSKQYDGAWNAGSVVFNADGRRLAVSGRFADRSDNHITILDVASGGEIAQNAQSANLLAASPDGNRLFASGPSGQVSVFDFETGAQILTLASDGRSAADLAPAPSGSLLARRGLGGMLQFSGEGDPTHAPISDKTFDLLPLFEKNNVAKGRWGFSEGPLTNVMGRAFDRVGFPVFPGDDYRVRVAYRKAWRAGPLGTFHLLLPIRGRLVSLNLDRSGDAVFHPDPGILTDTVKAPDSLIRREVEVIVMTRSDEAEIVLTQDNRSLARWRGDVRQLPSLPDWALPHAGILGAGTGRCQVLLDRLEVTPMSALGAYLASHYPLVPTDAQMLPNMMDLTQVFQEGSLRKISRAGDVLVELPIIPRGSYALSSVVEYSQEADARRFSMILPVKKGIVSLEVRKSANDQCEFALNTIDGGSWDASKCYVRHRLESGRQYGIRIVVLVKNSDVNIRVDLDAERFLEWRGNPRRLSWRDRQSHGDPRPDPGMFAISDNDAFLLYDLRFEVLEGAAFWQGDPNPATIER